mmetsp:Transcript_9334/g.21157  ORF Transcript_9334/g.21157 Transcript_9334/m.21157 type:complete len:202 (+) Transcript_9334:1469-2074(+)
MGANGTSGTRFAPLAEVSLATVATRVDRPRAANSARTLAIRTNARDNKDAHGPVASAPTCPSDSTCLTEVPEEAGQTSAPRTVRRNSARLTDVSGTTTRRSARRAGRPRRRPSHRRQPTYRPAEGASATIQRSPPATPIGIASGRADGARSGSRSSTGTTTSGMMIGGAGGIKLISQQPQRPKNYVPKICTIVFAILDWNI